jgi:hypothetical protein
MGAGMQIKPMDDAGKLVQVFGGASKAFLRLRVFALSFG